MSAVLAAEPLPGRRVYLCAFESETGENRGSSSTVTARRLERRDIRDAVAIAALCEIAEESAAGGDLDELLGQLVALRITEQPEGIDEAEAAVRALQHTIGAAAARDARASGRDRRGDAPARAGARPGRAVTVYGGAEGRPGAIDELVKEVEATLPRPAPL